MDHRSRVLGRFVVRTALRVIPTNYVLAHRSTNEKTPSLRFQIREYRNLRWALSASEDDDACRCSDLALDLHRLLRRMPTGREVVHVYAEAQWRRDRRDEARFRPGGRIDSEETSRSRAFDSFDFDRRAFPEGATRIRGAKLRQTNWPSVQRMPLQFSRAHSVRARIQAQRLYDDRHQADRNTRRRHDDSFARKRDFSSVGHVSDVAHFDRKTPAGIRRTGTSNSPSS